MSTSNPVRRFRVTAKDWGYDVIVGRGAWRELRRFPRATYSTTFVLTEKPLWRRWGATFLRESGLAGAQPLLVPSGEKSKSLRMVETLAAQLIKRGADRRSLLVALGGGVVGDLGGFLASTYMRGIDSIQVPTTVVAQVDSAIGGKTGVDVGGVKNLVGTFYPPRVVLADPNVLSTLNKRTFLSGLYEVVKHGIVAGSPLFEELEAGLDSLRPASAPRLGTILARAAQVKVEVVCRDEREGGLRRVLNLGHTFGHAFEEVTRYRRFLHGEAVGWGLLAATRLAERLGVSANAHRPGSDAQRIVRLIRRVGPLPPLGDLEPTRILDLLSRDKKTVGGKIHWVLPEGIGKVRIVSDVPTAVVAATLRDLQVTTISD